MSRRAPASLRKQLQKSPLPRHIAVIMDGNGRWAKKRKLQRIDGHRAGADVVDSLMDSCLELKIPVVSLYAFSTENWRRPASEVKALFEILNLYITDKLPKMMEHDIRFIVSGDISKLPKRSQSLIKEGIEKTKRNKSLLTNFCLNYGARTEIMRAIQLLIENRAKKSKGALARRPTEKEFEKYLYTSGLPDVDLLIRTSGEERLSNFLLYQCAYAEFYFTDVHWPDFNESEFYRSLIEFQRRDRRYGGLR